MLWVARHFAAGKSLEAFHIVHGILMGDLTRVGASAMSAWWSQLLEAASLSALPSSDLRGRSVRFSRLFLSSEIFSLNLTLLQGATELGAAMQLVGFAAVPACLVCHRLQLQPRWFAVVCGASALLVVQR